MAARTSARSGESLGDLVVAQIRRSPVLELEHHLEDDVWVARLPKPTASVAEIAIPGVQITLLHRVAVEDVDPGDDRGDLLAVGADILDRRRPRGAGDSRETLDSGETLPHCSAHDIVPDFTGGDRHPGATPTSLDFHPQVGDSEHQPADALISHHHVGSATEDVDRQRFRACPPQSLPDIVDARSLDQPISGSSEVEGCQGREGFVGRRFGHEEQSTLDSPPETRWEGMPGTQHCSPRTMLEPGTRSAFSARPWCLHVVGNAPEVRNDPLEKRTITPWRTACHRSF